MSIPLREPRQSVAMPIVALFCLACLSPAAANPWKEGYPSKEGDPSKKDEWKVDEPPGERRRATLETDEGTWMSLDVSPRGDGEIIFDLLGDIYRRDSDGRTEALSSGVAWDMQPRYSPDGALIAFTSDRGGGDNLWVMKRDGSDPRQVTQESFRLLNSPVWTPDGQYLAARKHFTSRRSLGAGEIWLYHVTGGSGVQLVARPNDQKDLGEPAFSPDGRYLYYSQDTTPGSTFEYNKDPHAGIYSIRRLDRRTGELSTVTGGAGGAIRPTPSPDGEHLAFIRRVRSKTVLFLRELSSGRETPLFDGLDRDLQETWAIHGVYPTLAWTPDSRALVVWAGGKIHRVEVATKASEVLPFSVRDHRSLASTLTRRARAFEEEFSTRMLRWVTVAPDGRSVIFQALGRLWIRSLNALDEAPGEARRLTRAKDRLEHCPAFSRDGTRVVFTTWRDRELGEVREIELTTGAERVLSPGPGHYMDPVYSPDGRAVVYRKLSGGYLRSPLHGLETGLWRVWRDNGTAKRLRSSGRAPHFGPASDRVYYRGRSEGKVSLESVDLHGHEARVHLRSENASELRVSPDGRWVAFAEGFRAWITPFIAAGEALSIGPKSRALPVARASKEAGECLHWSGDSERLHWSLGPDLYTRELSESFDFLAHTTESDDEKQDSDAKDKDSKDSEDENDDEEDEERPEPITRTALGFEAPADQPEGLVAFSGARVILMDSDEVLEGATVVVEGNRIRGVGQRVEVPEGTKTFDASGLTIVPGFVDVHAHGPRGADEIIPEQNWKAFAELTFGVTTIHDPSTDTSTFFAASELQKAGRILSPRLFSTGTILYGAAGSAKSEVESLEDALFHLKRMQAVGAFSVKSYNQPRRDQRQMVVEAGRQLDMLVVPEGGSLFQHNLTMVVDGHTTVEHCLPQAKVYRDVTSIWGQSGTAYTPTLGVAYGGLSGEYYWYHHDEVWADPRLGRYVPRRLLDARALRRPLAPEEDYNHIRAAGVAKALQDAGVRVNLGAHGQREGLAAHWELWMFVQGGMSELEALRACTLNGARTIGVDRDLGSISRGKLADFLVLEKNPLENIRNSREIRYTVLNGRVYDAKSLAEVWPEPKDRAPFFFEAPGEASTRAFESSGCGCGHP